MSGSDTSSSGVHAWFSRCAVCLHRKPPFPLVFLSYCASHHLLAKGCKLCVYPVPALRNRRVALVSSFNLVPPRSKEKGLSPPTFFFFNSTLCRLHHKRPRTPCFPPQDAAPGAHDLGAPTCLGSFHSLIFLEGISKSYPLLVQGSQRLRFNTAELFAFRLEN